MKHFGDITKIKGSDVPLVDIVCGGSPCQDLSIAGRRKGLSGERSGLFMEQIRIIKEMRERDKSNRGADVDIRFLRPRFMVWENVPGAFSSNGGEDFRAVLEETAKIADENAHVPRPEGNFKWSKAGCIMGDGWSIAWRVHDAQFWGVPQRRKRIALVADFGGASAPEILFERKSLSGDIAKSGKERQRAAKDAEGCVGETDATFKVIGFNRERCGAVAMDDMMPTLQVAAGESGNNQPMAALSFQERAGKPGGGKGILIQNERTGALSTLNNQSVCAFEPGAASRVGGHVYEDDVAATVRANAGDNQQAVVYGISAYDSNAMKSNNPNSGIYEAETSRTLDLNGGSPACNQGGMAVVSMATKQLSQNVGDNVAMPICANDYKEPQVVCLEGNGSRPSHQGDGWHEGDPMYTLNSTEHHAVVVENHPADSRVKISEDGMVQTLSSRMGTGGNNVPMVMYPEKTTGSLMASGYDKLGTQEAMNDMFVVESSAWDGSQVSPTLTVNNVNGGQRMPDKDNFNAVLTYGLDRAAYNQGMNAQYDFAVDEEKVGTQVAKGPGAVCNNYVVRRLTPMECERLQGFPDCWTDIGDWIDSKGKKHKGDADSPRYKALGNSIALPFWEWMAKRMVEQLKADGVENPTMASLFDGIGGFPLVYQRCGCEPVWASEIEEFPIAVTKIRFPEGE